MPFRWFFFINEHARGFRAVFEEAWKWAGSESELPGLSLSVPASPQVSHRLAALPWREKGGMVRTLEACTLLDAFYIQLGQAKRGEVEPSAFASLTRWTTKTLEGEPLSRHAYLNKGVCLCTEVDEGLSAERETMVFLYTPSATSQVSHFVHFTLPQLLSNLVKARVIAKEYNHHLLPQAQRQEQDLGTLIKQAAQPHLPLELLERLSANISRQQAAFIESISALEEQLQTLKVCMHNIELCWMTHCGASRGNGHSNCWQAIWHCS